MKYSRPIRRGYKSILPSHFYSTAPVIFKVWVLAILFFISCLFVAKKQEVPLGDLLRDTTAVLDAPVYIGLISNIGGLVWAAAATVCFLGFAILRKRKEVRLQSFMLLSGLLSSMLLLDDFFRLHEEVLPKYFGIGEKMVVAAYGIFTMYYLMRFRNVLLRTEYLLLFSAVALLGISVAIDQAPFAIAFRYAIEDGAKFLGAITWLMFFGRLTMAELSKNQHVQRADDLNDLLLTSTTTIRTPSSVVVKSEN